MKYIAYFLAVPFFTTFFSCTEPMEEIILPEGWEKIPGEYQGSVSKTNKNPPHERIYYKKPFNAIIASIDNYYTIEFEKNDSIQLPILNLEVIDSEQQYVYFDIVDTPGYIADNDLIGNNQFLISLISPWSSRPHIDIRLKMISGDYRIKFYGTKYLNSGP